MNEDSRHAFSAQVSAWFHVSTGRSELDRAGGGRRERRHNPLGADSATWTTVDRVELDSDSPYRASRWCFCLVVAGRTHLRRKTRARQTAAMRLCDGCPPPVRLSAELPELLRNILPFALEDRRWTEGVFPPAMVKEICVLEDGDAAFAAMEEAITNAKTEIRVMFYIWQVGPTGERFAMRLAERARAGV